MSPGATVPVTVLTGFLGSGKTTTLNRLLKAPHLADTVVIVNELGEIALDHLLIESKSENLVLLSNGCVCCTVRIDLVDTLRDLLTERGRRIAAMPRVIVETTGLADPAPILHTLIVDPAIAPHYRLQGVVATVDGVNGARTLDSHFEAVKQAAVADRILLTKGDLASAEGLAALKSRLHTLNPGAPVVEVVDGRIEPAGFFSPSPYDPDSRSGDVREWLRESGADHDDDGDDHHDGHDHGGVGRHDDHINAYSFAIDGPVNWSDFTHWLELMAAMRGEELLRVKGLVARADEPDRPMVVHGVQNIFHPPVQLERWPSADRRTRLVFITRDIPRDLIERTLAKFANIGRDQIALV